ncbi:MAG TPA: right-handed parallel beta-helix repeat-containing protein [Micromonosporaceae bacterium]|nr:right-handed parallel beta-helix repeat-containing protein [Micromonosporaceae bacterium]
MVGAVAVALAVMAGAGLLISAPWADDGGPGATPGTATSGTATSGTATSGTTTAVAPPPSDATWVSASGDDTGTGTQAQPWRTLAHAVRTAPEGSRIAVREGNYEPFTVDRAGLSIASAPGERATIQGRAGVRDVVLVAADNVVLSDLTVAGCVPNANPNVNVPGDHGSGIRVHRTNRVSVRNVIVRDSHGVNAAGLPVGCYGILATESRDLLVASSEVFHNGGGIHIAGGGRGVVVEQNNVHDQDVILQNSRQSLDDFGGYGLGATAITDKPGPTFRSNTVLRNFGPSTDYGFDGGGMEIYDAANTTITGNTFADNDGTLETGTGSKGRCADNVFSDNTVTGRSGAGGPAKYTGLVLRCASNMAIRNNTFVNVDRFVFLYESGGAFSGAVDGLQVVGNTVTQQRGAVVHRLQFGTGKAPEMSVDENRYQAIQDRFAVIGTGPSEATVSFSEWKSRTGLDARSTTS